MRLPLKEDSLTSGGRCLQMRQNNVDPNNKREWFTNLTIVDALYQGLVGEDKEQHVFQGEALAQNLGGGWGI